MLVALAIHGIPGAALLVFDRELRILMVRGTAVGEDSVLAGAVEGQRAPDCLAPDQWDQLRPLAEQALDGGVASAQWRSADGSRPYLVRTSAIRSRSGRVLGGVLLATEVTDLRADGAEGSGEPTGRLRPRSDAVPLATALEEEDRQLARDALTGLPTEAEFREGLDRILGHPPRAGQRVAVVHLGLDGLTAVNDAHGQVAGDRVLVICTRRIRSLLRSDDLLARLHGDEFLALVTSIRDPSDARRVTDHLHSVVGAPIPLESGGEVTVSMSVGVVMVDHSASSEEAIRQGGNALSRAKAAGGGSTVFQ